VKQLRKEGATTLRLRLIASLAILGALLVSSVAFGASTSTKVIVKPTTIKVTLADYSIHFSKASVKKGTTVIFKVHNAGALGHNVDLVGYKKTAILAGGGNATMKITFKKKATIEAVCDVPRHAELGMISSFKVI
jgi:uncharacterized cupredoxin-like copper-binding protein